MGYLVLKTILDILLRGLALLRTALGSIKMHINIRYLLIILCTNPISKVKIHVNIKYTFCCISRTHTKAKFRAPLWFPVSRRLCILGTQMADTGHKTLSYCLFFQGNKHYFASRYIYERKRQIII